MSDYLITREGKELGSYSITQIQEGLKTGTFKDTDWGWREGMEGWLGLSEIAGSSAAAALNLPKPTSTKGISSPLSAPVKKLAAAKNPEGLNPYAAPAAGGDLADLSGGVHPLVLAELRGTRPWVRFLSVLMWIVVAFMILAIIGQIMFGTVMMQMAGVKEVGAAYTVMVTVIYGFATLLVLYPTLKLSKYASGITRLVQSRSSTDLAAALAEQRRFWKFHGIITLIYLSLVVLAIVLALLFAPRNLQLPAKKSVSSAPALELRMEGRHGKA